MKLVDLFSKLVRNDSDDVVDASNAFVVNDTDLIRRFVSNSANTIFVSFPRTGSHWLRMLMELYYERPSLKLVFQYPERVDYLTYHTHDLQLDIEHPTVIYLYRNPVDTVYSQLNYHKEVLHNPDRVKYWADLYGKHLDKWLKTEGFTVKKTTVLYEGFKNDIVSEFAKITAHFGDVLDVQKILRVAASVTKDEVKRKTSHDQQVINRQKNYEEIRLQFNESMADVIWESLLNKRQYLKSEFFSK